MRIQLEILLGIQPHGGEKTCHYWWLPGPLLSSCKIAFVA
jgi:hypothetical protein